MPHRTKEIAKALLAHLEAASYSRPFAAQRGWTVSYERAELEGVIRITVVAASKQADEQSEGLREATVDTHRVSVGVQTAVDSTDVETIDELLDFVTEIETDLKGRAMDGAQWIDSQHDPLVDEDHLRQFGVFTSVLSLTYHEVNEAWPT